MLKKCKKTLKIILIFLVIINLMVIIPIPCYASPVSQPSRDVIGEDGGTGSGGSLKDTGVTDVTENPGLWKPSGSGSSSSFEKKLGNILGIVRVVGIIASVISLSLIGIKFMLGSVEEKANYKQRLMPWLIGAILLFAMTNIPAIIYNVSQGLF